MPYDSLTPADREAAFVHVADGTPECPVGTAEVVRRLVLLLGPGVWSE